MLVSRAIENSARPHYSTPLYYIIKLLSRTNFFTYFIDSLADINLMEVNHAQKVNYKFKRLIFDIFCGQGGKKRVWYIGYM